MNIKPVVDWKSPETTPSVPKGETKTFWLAVGSSIRGEFRTFVFDAQYVNKPLEYAEDDIGCECPLDDECFVTSDGDPIECIGWFDVRNHQDFDNYYEPLSFNEDYTLLGWAEYEKPDFTGI